MPDKRSRIVKAAEALGQGAMSTAMAAKMSRGGAEAFKVYAGFTG